MKDSVSMSKVRLPVEAEKKQSFLLYFFVPQMLLFLKPDIISQ